MALKNVLPLDPVVNIIVNLAAVSATRKKFNLALLMGDVGSVADFSDKRIVTYDSLNSMLQAGFTTEDRLYKAAALIFGQRKKPPLVAIGKIANKETPIKTIQACRQEDSEWYAGIYCGDMTDAQLLEVQEFVEACTPSTMFAFTTSDNKAKSADGGIFGAIKSKGYRRIIGQYSTSHKDAICAVLGWAMGAMSASTINSAFTLAYKREVGVQAENYMQTFTTNDLNNIKKNYGNVYVNRGNYYDVFEEGRVGDGSWFDEIIYLDKFKNDMQLSIMDLLVNANKLPQTEAGMGRIKTAIKEVCDDMNRIGFIKEGVWKGEELMSLEYGQVLPSGYLIQSEPINEQSQAERDARNAPPIYVSLKLAGAIHHVTIQVDVNR
jgi:putative bacteriophage protein|nr:MAG TPA: tail sheath protein [Caudoviricetes sp.]